MGQALYDLSYIIFFNSLQSFKEPIITLILDIRKTKFKKILNPTDGLTIIYLSFNSYLWNTYHAPGMLEINSKQEKLNP